MSWQVVRLEEAAKMPWRNGGGITRELAAWPDSQHWRWRISVAEVARSGPFSRFDGVERWFAVLQGAGVQLKVDEDPHRLTADDLPFFFEGAAATDCQLIDGATQDLNLMVRKGHAPSRMVRVSDSLSVTLNAPEIIAVYAINTEASVLFNTESLQLPGASLAWRAVSGKATVRIDAAQALWMEIPA